MKVSELFNVFEAVGDRYADQLAKKIFAINPNIGHEKELLSVGYKQALKDLHPSAAKGLFYHDEDFPSDFVSAYNALAKEEEAVTEAVDNKQFKKACTLANRIFDADHDYDDIVSGLEDHDFSPEVAKAVALDMGRTPSIKEASGNFLVKNKDGKVKRFPSTDSPAAIEWKNSSNPPKKAKAKDMWDDEEKEPEIDLHKVYTIAMNAFNNFEPGVTDSSALWYRIRPALKKLGVSEFKVRDVVDQSMAKFGTHAEKKGFDSYLRDMWDDMVKDAMFDAKSQIKKGQEPDDSNFYTYRNGKLEARPNPY